QNPKFGRLALDPGRLQDVGNAVYGLANSVFNSIDRMVNHGSTEPRDVLAGLSVSTGGGVFRAGIGRSALELGSAGGNPQKIRALVSALRGQREFEEVSDANYGDLSAKRNAMMKGPASNAADLAATHPDDMARILQLQKGTGHEALADIAEQTAASQ